MAFGDELEMGQQQDITAYFHRFERREVGTSSIFVCTECGYVYDDFSGEKQSMEGDSRSFCKVCDCPHVDYLGRYVQTGEIRRFRKKNPNLIEKTECLSCGPGPVAADDCALCDTSFRVMGCQSCSTLYAWLPQLTTRLLYLTPLTDEDLLDEGPTGIPL